jgi:hypothetical protein
MDLTPLVPEGVLAEVLAVRSTSTTVSLHRRARPIQLTLDSLSTEKGMAEMKTKQAGVAAEMILTIYHGVLQAVMESVDRVKTVYPHVFEEGPTSDMTLNNYYATFGLGNSHTHPAAKLAQVIACYQEVEPDTILVADEALSSFVASVQHTYAEQGPTSVQLGREPKKSLQYLGPKGWTVHPIRAIGDKATVRKPRHPLFQMAEVGHYSSMHAPPSGGVPFKTKHLDVWARTSQRGDGGTSQFTFQQAVEASQRFSPETGKLTSEHQLIADELNSARTNAGIPGMGDTMFVTRNGEDKRIVCEVFGQMNEEYLPRTAFIATAETISAAILKKVGPRHLNSIEAGRDLIAEIRSLPIGENEKEFMKLISTPPNGGNISPGSLFGGPAVDDALLDNFDVEINGPVGFGSAVGLMSLAQLSSLRASKMYRLVSGNGARLGMFDIAVAYKNAIISLYEALRCILGDNSPLLSEVFTPVHFKSNMTGPTGNSFNKIVTFLANLVDGQTPVIHLIAEGDGHEFTFPDKYEILDGIRGMALDAEIINVFQDDGSAEDFERRYLTSPIGTLFRTMNIATEFHALMLWLLDQANQVDDASRPFCIMEFILDVIKYVNQNKEVTQTIHDFKQASFARGVANQRLMQGNVVHGNTIKTRLALTPDAILQASENVRNLFHFGAWENDAKVVSVENFQANQVTCDVRLFGYGSTGNVKLFKSGSSALSSMIEYNNNLDQRLIRAKQCGDSLATQLGSIVLALMPIEIQSFRRMAECDILPPVEMLVLRPHHRIQTSAIVALKSDGYAYALCTPPVVTAGADVHANSMLINTMYFAGAIVVHPRHAVVIENAVTHGTISGYDLHPLTPTMYQNAEMRSRASMICVMVPAGTHVNLPRTIHANSMPPSEQQKYVGNPLEWAHMTSRPHLPEGLFTNLVWGLNRVTASHTRVISPGAHNFMVAREDVYHLNPTTGTRTLQIGEHLPFTNLMANFESRHSVGPASGLVHA